MDHTISLGPATNGQLASPVTAHASARMLRRNISKEAISAALLYGREVYTRGAYIYGIGRKEEEFQAQLGVDLTPFRGVQVVCSVDGAVLTVYRNADFRGLRPKLGKPRRSHRAGRLAVA